MFRGLYVLGVTPARAGSKRVVGKNIRPFMGRPLLTYAVEALAKSRYIDSVVLSTDDPVYAAAGAAHGAQTPSLRPAALADDKARLFEVMAYEMREHEKRIGRAVDVVVSVQASAPLLRPETIDALVELTSRDGVEAAGTTSLITQGHPYLARRREEDGALTEFLDLPEGTPRYPSQVRPSLEYFNGCAFARRRVMLDPPDASTNALGARPQGLPMADEEAVNIDTEFDFKLATLLYSERN